VEEKGIKLQFIVILRQMDKQK